MSPFLAAGGARIARGMLGYMAVMAALATLSPFDFQNVPERHFAVLWLFSDALINLLLLFPVGFLYALAYEQKLGRQAVNVLGLGLVLSFGLEFSQLFLPTRHANLVDVLTNGLGCWAGALVARGMGRWLEGFLSEDLVLELPLTGALYLLVPLLTLHGLGAGNTSRPWMALPLAPFGAIILATLYQQRIARSGTASPWRFALYGALAFAGAALPALLRRPGAIATAAACLLLTTWALIRFRVGWSPSQRRFEASTVRRAAPWFALYLLGLALYPSFGAHGGRPGVVSHLDALRLLESFAALTVYGYLVSQVVSRSALSPRLLVGAIAASGLALSLVLEFTGTTSAGLVSHLLRLSVLGASAAAGAALHRAQVTLVRAMRARTPRGSFAPLYGDSLAPLYGDSLAPMQGGSLAPRGGGSLAPMGGRSLAPMGGGSLAPPPA
jgi:glycopeptide antibiotics resistance protein